MHIDIHDRLVTGRLDCPPENLVALLLEKQQRSGGNQGAHCHE